MKVERRIELFEKKFGYEPEAFEICPKFEKCSCNKCPLHKKFNELKSESSDPEIKCKLPKRVRSEIGTYFKLKNKGLKFRELSAMKKWEEMPEKEKQERIAKLKQNSPITRLKSKGYAIVRVKSPNLNFTYTNNSKCPSNATYEHNSNDLCFQKRQFSGGNR